MGLDSIVRMHCRNKIKDEDIPYWINKDSFQKEESEDTFSYEVSYFRKAWAIHDLMYELCPNMPIDGEAEVSYKEMELYRDALINVLKYADAHEAFDERSQVFQVSDLYESIASQIVVCSWAIEYAKKHPDVYFVFIDSY